MVQEEIVNDRPKKLTVDEFELQSFTERQRLEKVKVKLNKFRRAETIFNTPAHMDLMKQKPTIFNPDKDRKKKGKDSTSLLTSKNIFGKSKSLLKQKNLFF